MSENIKVPKGLAGVVVDQTSISKVMPETNSLTYRGYAVQDLCAHCSFLEVAYLLVFGKLPNEEELEQFKVKERQYRALSPALHHVIKQYPKQAHPMDFLRTGVSFLGMEDDRIWDHSKTTNQDKFTKLLAAIPVIAAHAYRLTIGQTFIEPREDLDFVPNFFWMCFGEIPNEAILKAFQVSLILYAEHSFNASTFTCRVITSTQSDLYSAICGGIGALKGSLHGGANEMVMHMMKSIQESGQQPREWLLNALSQGEKIMGFGHRVYRNGDSRVPTMYSYTKQLADDSGDQTWITIYEALRQTMLEEKNIYPNLDFPAGPAYYMMGFPIDFFTPIFVMSRVSGWSAHCIEQTENNRIIRPLSDYIGPTQRQVQPIQDRQ